jgi:hypothetical protein
MSLSGGTNGLETLSTQLGNIDDLTQAVSRRLSSQLMSVNYAVNNIRDLLRSVNGIVDKLLPAFVVNASDQIEGIRLSTPASEYVIVINSDGALEIRKRDPDGSFVAVGRFL